MLNDAAAFATVLGAVTALLGGYVALGFMLKRAMPLQRLATCLHGLGAFAVVTVLWWASFMPSSTVGAGRGPAFLSIGFWMLAPAVVLGLGALATRHRQRPVRGLAIGAHASVAIFGITILLAAAAT